jgi:plasmid stability protein
MGDLLIRNVPEAMKRDIAERAERNGNSLSDEMKSLLRKAMADHDAEEKPVRSAWESLQEVFAPLTAEEKDEFAKIMEEIEAERKKDFGRPFEDFE